MANAQPQPQLNLFFACEDAAVNVSETDGDLQFGWWELKKPLYHVWMPRGVAKGFGVPELLLYYQLTSGRGDYQMIVELWQTNLVEPHKNLRLAWSNFHAIHCDNELSVIEDVVVLKKVPFPTPGLYQFVAKIDGAILPGGECYLRVFSGVDQ